MLYPLRKLNRAALRTLLRAAVSLAAIAGPLGLALINTPSSFAQHSEEASHVSFQVATIQANESGEGRCVPNASIIGPTFTVRNCPLGELILFAYDVLQEQVSGKTFLLEEKYDVTAKAAHPVSRDEMRRMLQSLLADRFKLKLRRETKNVPVYELVVGKDGPTFHQSLTASDEGPKRAKGSNGEYIIQNAAMSDMVFALSRRLPDRMVVDKTGLQGKYDFDMTWYLELGKPHPPSVFDAVERTGLKLQPQTSPVEYLVIDHVESPSENRNRR